MEMSLQESITSWFKKPTVDPTQNPNYFSHTQYQNDTVFSDDYEDRFSTNDLSERGQLIHHHHVGSVQPYDKEPMFEKPLTPSDVGKLNRLVIPKQYAEKYFPLGGGDSAGTLLGFEDEAGKCWRFRYSYWNSSQSYVLTKGWSRYVKEKRLDAGDVVFFERHRADPERLFIGWRRRGAGPPGTSYNAQGYYQAQDSGGQGQGGGGGGGAGMPPYQAEYPHAAPGVSVGAEAAVEGQEATAGSSNSRRLVRLFGVNLECQLDDSTSQTTSFGGSFFPPQQQLLQQQQQAYHNYFDYNNHSPSSNHHNHFHLDMNFGQDVKRMGNRLG